MKCKIALIACSLVLALESACASGGAELPPQDGSALVRASEKGTPSAVSAYLLADTENRAFMEGMYLPQAAAAYLPICFSATAKDQRLSFDQTLPYRVLSRSSLAGGVLRYNLELSPYTVDYRGRRYEGGRSYTFSFPLSALGRSGGVQTQPAQYALERAIRISSVRVGLARIESLRFDESAELFRASVNVAAQSSKR